MEILVGRDESTRRLMLSVNGQPMVFGRTADVPVTVAKSHCMIESTNGSVRIRNLDMNHDTFVNGHSVEVKQIMHGDLLSLGDDRYPLDWSLINQVIPPVADITHLQKVWRDFDTHRMDQQIADRKFGSLRSATGIITMAAIALSMMTGRQSFWYVVLYAFAILVSLAFTIKAYRDASSVPQKMKELERQFQQDYVCPHCGHFLGNQSYVVLSQNPCCPYCKSKFIH